MTVMAIDPGPVESAYCWINNYRTPLEYAKLPNEALLHLLQHGGLANHVAIEMVASYGMAVGAEVFDTCVWIGRFQQGIEDRSNLTVELIKRQPVKMHHCHDSRAKDSNITQALVDRFARGLPNRGKGTKDNPGWFYGFSGDIWQAYALAVYVADREAAA